MGDDRNRLVGLDMVMSNEAVYVRLRWPELPLLEVSPSENRGALSGELIRVLDGYGSSDVLDEESDRTSPSQMRRRRSSSILGSIVSRVRSSQPCFVLNCAKAKRPCSLRAILLTSTRLSTLSATASGCFFKGDDMVVCLDGNLSLQVFRFPMTSTQVVTGTIKKDCRDLV